MAKGKGKKGGGKTTFTFEIEPRPGADMGEVEHVTMHFCMEVAKIAEIGPISLPGMEANMMLVKMLDFAAENPNIARRWRDAVWAKFRENPKYRASREQFERERAETRDELRARIAAALEADGDTPAPGGMFGGGAIL